LLAIGSPLIFLSSFHISNVFPARSGLILSLIMAGFNASSMAFVLFDWLDKKYVIWRSFRETQLAERTPLPGPEIYLSKRGSGVMH
jgi:hypothetical protein